MGPDGSGYMAEIFINYLGKSCNEGFMGLYDDHEYCVVQIRKNKKEELLKLLKRYKSIVKQMKEREELCCDICELKLLADQKRSARDALKYFQVGRER